MRRADALVLLTQITANSGNLPAQGGDRPQVHVTMNLGTLQHRLGRAKTLNNRHAVSPGAARRSLGKEPTRLGVRTCSETVARLPIASFETLPRSPRPDP